MTETIVQYHADGYDAARPAINVKAHYAGRDYWHPALEAAFGDLSDDPNTEEAYDRIQELFWQDASTLAEEIGLGGIEQEGRSGGWLVFTDGRDPQDMELCDTVNSEPCTTACRAGWLAAYRSMVEWADAWIADAPRKVRDLAQQLAMDEAGEATVTLRSWLAFGLPAEIAHARAVAANEGTWMAGVEP